MLRVLVLVLLPLGLASSPVICPDGKVCPDRSTCCDTETGYECCPVPNAICCPDRSNCCPRDFRCNTLTQMCERDGRRMPILWKMAAKPSHLSIPNTAKTDPKMAEQDECCLSSMGCCPAGFHCDGNKDCVRDKKPSPWAELQHALSIGSQGGVTYCDRKFYCPSNNTCFRSPTDQWTCCPYPLGQICRDKQHCCEYGYSCHRSSKTCAKIYANVPAALNEAAKRN
ncbi:hypothetical protein SKAU_G00398180 [Synaphobranchus kaupii]|uniref:Granulins domain-containing protein n=1 Tax=Synaphobranchus kaupii TaxID=118154 RepID=A0A9Q1E8I6_SYNKA|nr:hypothetical protein SKAU_G00398180 [Synaphobranchus kaupii]